jgi:hypothetical protein
MSGDTGGISAVVYLDLVRDPDRKKVKDSGELKRAEPPLWSR